MMVYVMAVMGVTSIICTVGLGHARFLAFVTVPTATPIRRQMAQSHRMRRHGVSALPQSLLPSTTTRRVCPKAHGHPLHRHKMTYFPGRESQAKPSSFSKSKFALPTLCVQDTVLGYKSRHESKLVDSDANI